MDMQPARQHKFVGPFLPPRQTRVLPKYYLNPKSYNEFIQNLDGIIMASECILDFHPFTRNGSQWDPVLPFCGE